jgi:D-tyrosyl-tRNA(Tyr) deacylase
MKVVLQRVSQASVSVNGSIAGAIGKGFLLLVGVQQGDTKEDCKFLAQKVADMRIFADEAGKMNKAIKDIGGQALVISQFTLMADWRKGRRPSFITAAEPKIGEELYEYFAQCLSKLDVPVEKGIFAADMQVSLINDGPVTIILENQLSPN